MERVVAGALHAPGAHATGSPDDSDSRTTIGLRHATPLAIATDWRAAATLTGITDEAALAGLCAALLPSATVVSVRERALLAAISSQPVATTAIDRTISAIQQGTDPLGECLLALRPAAQRRADGAVYTPATILAPMIAWLRTQGKPVRVVDPGAGSGRFILAAGAAFDNAQLIAVETDPLAALVLRTNLHLRGMTTRSQVLVDDYRRIKLPKIAGMTAFVGNPPYVRHHHIGARWKHWYTRNFKTLGIHASAMAGLHLHFFLKTALLASANDVGTFVTSAEWLDVNYGAALRKLLTQHLGVVGLHVLAPAVEGFSGTATTTAISCFRGAAPQTSVRVRAVNSLTELAALDSGAVVLPAQLDAATRWSSVIYPVQARDSDTVPLGELFRVLRGQVTGANRVWVFGDDRPSLPDSVLIPTITRAQDLIRVADRLESTASLRRVVDLAPDLDCYVGDEREQIDAYLTWARRHRADQGYIARHRRAWWSVGLREPAPILCTYMARRAPQFTLNVGEARHINVAHGLYPRQPMSERQLAAIVEWLNRNVEVGSGRTYAWGLIKFEPKEVQQLRIPAHLASG